MHLNLFSGAVYWSNGLMTELWFRIPVNHDSFSILTNAREYAVLLKLVKLFNTLFESKHQWISREACFHLINCENTQSGQSITCILFIWSKMYKCPWYRFRGSRTPKTSWSHAIVVGCFCCSRLTLQLCHPEIADWLQKWLNLSTRKAA